MEIRIEGANIFSEQDFHSQLARELGVQQFYGKNLDALWDLLSAGVEWPLVLTWKDHKVSEGRLGSKFNRIIGVLNEVRSRGDSFKLKEGFLYYLE
ncbi:Barstar [compost metagenome]